MWIKICGIRDEATGEAVCRLAPDAIGLNFYARSPRVIDRETAARISAICQGRVLRMGLFVNHPASAIVDLAGACQLDAIQLHGDESPAQLAELTRQIPGMPIYRAWRMDGESLVGLNEHLRACQQSNLNVEGCLIDARVDGAYGGTGHTVPWDALARQYRREQWPPLILAGGLTATNVAAAIRTVRPWGVDVASGVESSAGIKDLDLVRLFIENARMA